MEVWFSIEEEPPPRGAKASWRNLKTFVSAPPERIRRAFALLTKTCRQLGSYSLTFRICPPGQRLSAPLVPLERFAIRLKKRRIANQAIRIETTSLLETKEFCGAAWPSK